MDEAIVLCDIGALPPCASFIGAILKDTGLPRPQNQQVEDLAVEVGPVRMDEAAAGKVLDDLRGFPVK
ncbi:hypothetical protein ACFWA6_23025 [Streptomyces sp. NPDC060020]|uniref:hypothetical protein n=1 Tax=Streptomyces sp. NPDC060020 TaxID=3347038 RepID=UPI0036A8D01B